MIKANRLLIPVAAGVAISATGAILVGYLSAIAISPDFFVWFKQYGTLDSASFLIVIASQFLSFGLLALLGGHMFGQTANWLFSTLVCFASMLSYLIILGPRDLRYLLSSQWLTFASLVLGCLLISAYRSNKKHNKKLAVTLDPSSAAGKQG